jgi:serine/threonine-protein kinase
MDLRAGEHFGSYRLLEAIGQGGMGQVWKAHDLRLERTVALKVVADASEEVRQALVAEAKTASRLSHPNIAVIYDAGEIGGVPFIAMELVEGRTLQAMMDKPWTEANLSRVAVQAAEALAHAHEKGIVHRDIKPSNLMVTPQGRLEILDFGIAKRDAKPTEAGEAATLMRVTAPGLSMGTPAYMSPEQVVGQAATPASDQFSLGLVLYELATGQHPFKQESVVETMHAILKQAQPPLRDARPDLSTAFTAAVDRALSKRAQDRFKDLSAFVAALDFSTQSTRALQITGEHAAVTAAVPSVPTRRPARRWILPAAAAVLVACAGGGWWFARQRAPKPASDLTVAILPLEQVVPNPAESWMATSLGDAMSMALSRQKGVAVLDRVWVGEMMHRLGEKPGQVPTSIQRLGKELKAQVWVLGTYQVLGDQMRVTVRTLDASKGSVVAQMVVSGSASNLLALEDELQARLPGLLGLREAGEAVDPHSRARSPQTRELFAKATDLASQGNTDSFDAAAKLYRRALEAEPDYAPARAGLAWALQGLGSAEAHLGRSEQAKAHFKEAESEAAKAVSLDPRLAFAHRALAACYNRLGRHAEAKQAASHAISLDPADAFAHAFIADALAYEDGPTAFTEAKAHYQKSLELAPDAWFAHYRYAVLLQNAGELEQSVEEARRASAIQPSSDSAHLAAANALIWLGRYDEAERELRAGLQQVPSARLLKLAQAVVAHSRRDAEAFKAASEPLRNAWPPENPTAVLLRGLERDMAGDTAAMLRIFQAAAAEARSPEWASRSASERRGASVNLYQMARAAALRKDKAAAEALLDAAEKLTSGKRKVAARDPAFGA